MFREAKATRKVKWDEPSRKRHVLDKRQKLILIALVISLAVVYFVKNGIYELKSNGVHMYRLNKFTGKVNIIKGKIIEEVYE